MKAPEKPKHKFDDKVSRIIDKVLGQIFGHEARFLIYKYLESQHSLRQDEIAGKIEVFAKGLRAFLDSGAYVVEKEILDEIGPSYGSSGTSKLGRRENDFADQIRMLRKEA